MEQVAKSHLKSSISDILDMKDIALITITSTVTYQRSKKPEPYVLLGNYDYFADSKKPPIYQELYTEEGIKEQITPKYLKCSTLCIVNDMGKYLEKVPTEDERKDIESRVIELLLKVNDSSYVVISEIPPKMNVIIHPKYELDRYYVTCRNKSANCSVLAIF